jgi:isopentenyl-diphosphate Delta-isomerase
MDELWQLYDEHGIPVSGKGSNKNEVFSKGLLHGAAHVWIWRRGGEEPEVLLQKRASNKRTWPNCYDISAAGHIDLAEEPLVAALRETKEEIGIVIGNSQLKLISVQRAYLTDTGGSIENEFQWLYLLELDNAQDFALQEEEVASLSWKPLSEFRQELTNNTDSYVPHGNPYYQIVIAAIEAAVA